MSSRQKPPTGRHGESPAWDHWVPIDGVIHRASRGVDSALCGITIDRKRIMTRLEILQKVKGPRKSACAQCESRYNAKHPAPVRRERQPLTPEQQAAREWLRSERKKRRYLRGAPENGSSSVRTVSGGLPGLGRGR